MDTQRKVGSLRGGRDTRRRLHLLLLPLLPGKMWNGKGDEGAGAGVVSCAGGDE